MFTTIAWATDGSASAAEALPVAEGLARATGGALVIIYVQEVTISRSGFLAEDGRAVLAALHRTARRLRGDGIPVTVLSARATARDVPRKILDLAGSTPAEVLVIGNRGHGSVINIVLGGVATRLLRIASMPIITVPSRSAAAAPLAARRRRPRAGRTDGRPPPGQPASSTSLPGPGSPLIAVGTGRHD